jgi:hypothetical protein
MDCVLGASGGGDDAFFFELVRDGIAAVVAIGKEILARKP